MEFKLIIDPTVPQQVVVTAKERSPFTDQLQLLVMEHNGTDSVAAFGQDDWQMLPFAQIECITVVDGKTYAIATDGQQYRLRQRLCELEPLLPGCFIRIHKSALANQQHLQRFAAGFGGAVDALFKSGHKEYVSRRCFAEIKRRFFRK